MNVIYGIGNLICGIGRVLQTLWWLIYGVRQPQELKPWPAPEPVQRRIRFRLQPAGEEVTVEGASVEEVLYKLEAGRARSLDGREFSVTFLEDKGEIRRKLETFFSKKATEVRSRALASLR